MTADPKLIEHLAKLARLNLSPAEKREFSEQIPKILDYVGKLRTADTVDSPPSADRPTQFRADATQPSDQTQEILSQAPDRLDDFWKVHSVF
jgi:aspartyl-tRNA(Asn)/glutamyl-tRNA(Gln) amidotransferase subunit C